MRAPALAGAALAEAVFAGAVPADVVGRIGTLGLPAGQVAGARHLRQRLRRPRREAFPFLSAAPLTASYLASAALWVAMVWGLTAVSFLRKGL